MIILTGPVIESVPALAAPVIEPTRAFGYTEGGSNYTVIGAVAASALFLGLVGLAIAIANPGAFAHGAHYDHGHGWHHGGHGFDRLPAFAARPRAGRAHGGHGFHHDW